ncbi:MAG: TonB family protein [Acidobacteria bacterium]|nr:TonB family protein [Acidobacteriota bacterium]
MIRRALLVAFLALVAPTLAGAATEEVAVVKTSFGEIVWRFFEKDAPGHTAYVKELIRRGFYDGTTFHRVIPHFVVQGGDPNSKNDDRLDDGEGEGDRRLKAEFSQTLHYRPGTVGMARDADPDSGSCQFFIALENIPRLDGRYTIFGEVISGLEVARRIAEAPRDLRDNPLEAIQVTVRLETREAPARLVSLEAAASGETVTGPTKPKPYDPKNVLWKAPTVRSDQTDLTFDYVEEARPRLDVVVDIDGSVLDVRFVALDTPHAADIRRSVLKWKFTPAGYDGKRQKVRFEIESDGTEMGPPTGPGSPMEIASATSAPVPSVRVDLRAGKKAPGKAAKLRLTIDESGAVTEAALQSGSGDDALDAAAVETARKMLFAPATRKWGPARDADPAAVYLDVAARFVEAEK